MKKILKTFNNIEAKCLLNWYWSVTRDEPWCVHIPNKLFNMDSLLNGYFKSAILFINYTYNVFLSLNIINSVYLVDDMSVASLEWFRFSSSLYTGYCQHNVHDAICQWYTNLHHYYDFIFGNSKTQISEFLHLKWNIPSVLHKQRLM